MGFDAPDRAGKINKGLLIGCIAGGVAIIVLAIVLLFTVGPFAHSDDDGRTDSAAVEHGSQTDADGSADGEDAGGGQSDGASGGASGGAAGGAIDDKAQGGTDISQQENVVYRNLTEAYEELGELDADIKQAAERFNADHLKHNMTLRSEEADDAYELLQEAQELQRELGMLHVPENSVNRKQAELIGDCVEDCIERIRVICNAWDISLSFANPEGHEDEIVAPIQSANEDGTSAHLTDFNEKYPQAKPVRP